MKMFICKSKSRDEVVSMSDFKTSSKVSFMTKRADQALKFYVSHFNRGLQQTFDEDSSFFLKMCTIKHTYWSLGMHL